MVVGGGWLQAPKVAGDKSGEITTHRESPRAERAHSQGV